LTITGSSVATFKAAAFIASPSLCTFIAKFSRGLGDRGDDGVYITLVVLHRLSHASKYIQHISFERDDPELVPTEVYVAWLESQPAMFVPQDLVSDLPKLQNLTVLSFKFIPFVDNAFTVQLVAVLPNLPQLRTLCLLPLPLSHHERHKLTLPTLECLRTLSSTNTALQHLTISIDMSTIPSDMPDILLPGHSLETLFIAPFYTPFKLSTPDLVNLSTYLSYSSSLAGGTIFGRQSYTDVAQPMMYSGQGTPEPSHPCCKCNNRTYIKIQNIIGISGNVKRAHECRCLVYRPALTALSV
jgi:hypothetical protein